MEISVILGFILAIGFAAGAALIYFKGKKGKAIIGGGAIIMIVCALLFFIVPFSFHTVQTGEVAVVKEFGEAKEVKGAGMHFDLWITTTYTMYDTKVQNVDISTSAYSSDAQTMKVAITLQYQILEDNVLNIVKEYGNLATLQNRIESVAIEKAKSVLSSYKAMDIIANRAQMSPAVETAIKEAIGESYFVNVNTVVLTNIDFSDAFELAVEEKMIAEQAKLKADYENQTKVAQAQAEADAKVKAAEAEQKIKEAEKAAELAAALADQEIASAEAEVARIKTLTIARTIGFTISVDENGVEYIDFENSNGLTQKDLYDYMNYLKYLEAWDGELPKVVGNGGEFILPPSLLE